MSGAGGRASASRLLLACTVVIVAVGAAVIAYARIPTSSGVITACVARGGAVRFVDTEKGQRCRNRERRVRFNQRGRRGARGPRGLPGGRGADGDDGAPGRDAGTIVDGGGGCAAIQAAIDGLPSGGGAVLVRSGAYVCSAPIVIDRDDVVLRGSGPATVLELGDHVNRPVVVLGQTIEVPTTTRRHIQVSDLSIDGNRANQEHQCSTSDCVGSDYLRNNGLSLRHVEDVVVERVSVTSPRSGGLVTELGSRRLTVRDFTVTDSQFDGIAGYQTEDSLFTGLNLHGNAGAGLSFDIDFNRNEVNDSVIEGNADVGVFMRDSSDNLFSDVLVRDSGSFGLFLAEVLNEPAKPASGNTFTGMVVAGSGQDLTRGGYGMNVANDSCVDNLLDGVQFVDNRAGGLLESSPGLVQVGDVITR